MTLEELDVPLSPESERRLRAGIEDAKAGRISPVPMEQVRKACDLSTTCPQCDTQMEPEHAHYICPKCHFRDSCCF